MLFILNFFFPIVMIRGCEILFEKGIRILYEIDSENIQFTYSLPESIKNAYEWVGFGLKKYADGGSMSHGDFVTIILESGLIQDRTGGDRNGRPKTDEEVGGSDDLALKKSFTSDDGNLNFSWQKKINTGDLKDVTITQTEPYYAMWALGMVSNGVLKHHEEKGKKIINFGCRNEFMALG